MLKLSQGRRAVVVGEGAYREGRVSVPRRGWSRTRRRALTLLAMVLIAAITYHFMSVGVIDRAMARIGWHATREPMANARIVPCHLPGVVHGRCLVRCRARK